MSHDHDPDAETRASIEELRTALAANGITLPSLGRDFGSPPLVILGNCNVATARALTSVLNAAHPDRRCSTSTPSSA
ncbi:hypothetical protein [Streptomyces sp. NPDC000410]|uniref:hypothetical protein n=1 Tax=Streptomyces sp. NPDC000410 TaxID=3154254 RepID=UPI003325851B